jgi:hypothetical protein
MKTVWIPVLSLLLSACTSVHYESPELARRPAADETVAVLPFVMVLEGKAPPEMTVEQIEAIEDAESLIFQKSFYLRLLDRSSVHRKKPILVKIQPPESTNALLAEAGIGVRESWNLPAPQLAEILGVDVVVRTSIRKTRYLSDLSSFGIDVGLSVLVDATEGAAGAWIPAGATTTHDIFAESAIEDGSTGEVLWTVVVERSTDWSRPANEVVEGITGKLAKKFPYRS